MEQITPLENNILQEKIDTVTKINGFEGHFIFICKDNMNVKVNKKIALISIKLLDILLEERNKSKKIIKLSVNSYQTCVKKVIQYILYHLDDGIEHICVPSMPLESIDLKKCIKNIYDLDFVEKLNIIEIFELLEFSDNLLIEPLSKILCAKIASLIRGKSVEQINNILSK